MSINYKTLNKLLVLGQIAKQELEFVDVIASCSPMRNGDYNARKYAIIEEYNTQKSKLEEEFEALNCSDSTSKRSNKDDFIKLLEEKGIGDCTNNLDKLHCLIDCLCPGALDKMRKEGEEV